MPAVRNPSSRGFTLVELLIVVIILGILAAVVIPTFKNSSLEAKESALAGNLATVRQAVSLYRVQHDETYPAETGTWDEFVTQLTTPTNEDGTAGGTLGPYLRGDDFPENPLSADATGVSVDVLPAGPAGANGYVYIRTTGELRADTLGSNAAGVAYWDL